MANNAGIKAVNDTPSRRVFAPYFKARWQNMQNIISEIFYAMVPASFLNYYNAYIKQWGQWATGFVPMLHTKDFFSTGMGYTVCDIFATECTSGGQRYESKNKELQAFITDWADRNADRLYPEMYFWACALGNCILKATPVKGEIIVDVVPINRVFFQEGRRGISYAQILNRFVSGGAGGSFYARETRTLMEGKPYYKVDLSDRTENTALTPIWNTNFSSQIPDEIKTQWIENYGDIVPGVWYELPECFTSLGLYNVKNKGVAVALSGMPGYSDSVLHTALDILYSIDYNYTQGQIDQYFGRTRVGVPPRMWNAGEKHIVDGQNLFEIMDAPLKDDFFLEVPGDNSVDGKAIQPLFLQPDLRGEARKYIRDADLEILASKVGLSSATLANHLSYNSTKTATQVREEEDTTEKSVNRKRALASVAINEMLKDVAQYYGYFDDVKIIWNRSVNNTSAENEELRRDLAAGVLPLDEYIKRRWQELDEDTVNRWVEKIKEERKEKEASPFNGISDIGL